MTRSEKILLASGISVGVGLACVLRRPPKSKQNHDRDWREILGVATNTDEVVDSFGEHLKLHAPNNLKSFQRLRQESPEAALAEAIVFGILQRLKLTPTVADVYEAGADFSCTHRPIWFTSSAGSWPLVVEATTLEPSSVERNSSWPNQVPDEVSGGAFGLLTDRITRRASDKVPQLAKHKMPRVLAIVSSHIGAGVLLSSTVAAEAVLVSNPQISQPIGGGESTQITDLRYSAFLRGNPQNREVYAQRQSISAVLLISVAGDRSSVLGVLHPEPRYPLDINAFPEIPFVKVSPWPVSNGQIKLEWVLGQPSSRDFKHYLIREPRGDHRPRLGVR